jgi:TonB-dependent starch-binding outer membrane protein SusC
MSNLTTYVNMKLNPRNFFTHVQHSCRAYVPLFLLAMLLSISGMTVSASATYKTKNLTIELKDMTLRQVFNEIERMTNMSFFYNENEFVNSHIESISFVDESLDNILASLEAKSGYNYLVVNNQVIVKRKAIQPVQNVVPVKNQQNTVRGVVTDMRSGETLPGVNISVAGTTQGTSSNMDGEYSITISDPNAVLVYSFIGYVSERITVGDQRVINVQLVPDLALIQEVVAIGYGTQRREEVTSSIATVSSDDFVATGTQNVLELVQGRVAGLNITRSQGNDPRSGTDIQIRGATSLRAGTGPLIVIDGVPGGNLDLLQASDIESFDILKDGSAAAIYGTRGSNGVILITTKKGSEGDPRFEYSTYMQHETVAKRPDNLTASEYRTLMSDTNNPYRGLMTDYGGDVDWYGQLLNTNNISHNHNLSMSGGTANTNYRASVYYRDDVPIALSSDRQQYGGRFNINHRGLNDRLRVSMNMQSNFTERNNMLNNNDFEQSVQRNPTEPIYNEDGSFLEDQAFNSYNPVARLAQEENETSARNWMGDAKATYRILPGLNASVLVAMQKTDDINRQYRMRDSKSSMDSFAGSARAEKRQREWTDRTLETTLDYTTAIAGSHVINAIAGYSYQDFSFEEMNMWNAGFLTDAFRYNNIGNGTYLRTGQAGMGSRKTGSTLIAFFGRANYAYDGKYLASFMLRREGSSKFGANNKWGNFPAVSLGWNIHRESFMENIDVLNELKFRVGYGVTGNQEGIDNYQSLVTLGTGGTYPIDGVWYQTFGPSRNPEPNLRWERKIETNIGVDFSLMSNRLSGSVDVYQRRTEDLLEWYNTQLPPFVLNNIFTNVGTITNNGVELYLNALLVQTSNASWRSQAIFAHQTNELTKLSDDVYKASYREFYNLPSPGALGPAIRTEEGGPTGGFYGKRFAGFNDDGKWLFYKADNTAVTVDQITDADLTYIGNGTPKAFASWTNTFTYGDFDFTVLLRGKFGYDILNLQQMYFGNKKWLPSNLLSSAVNEYNQLNDDPQYSDFYLERGDFVKLDNLTFGYTINTRNMSSVNSLRVYASARNLATFTNYSGLDPEVRDTGIEPGIDFRGFYPRTRTFVFGLNVGF